MNTQEKIEGFKGRINSFETFRDLLGEELTKAVKENNVVFPDEVIKDEFIDIMKPTTESLISQFFN